MGFHPDTVEAAAEARGVATDRLGDTLQRVRNYAADNVEEYLERAWHVDHDDALLGDLNESYVVALDSGAWDDLADQLVIHDPALEATKAVHRRYAEDRLDLEAGDVPEGTTPFVIDYPENWSRALGVVHQYWGHFFHHGLTPAEVVDYWMVQKSPFTPENWAEVRGVGPEAVRKNVRGARAKLPQDLPL